MGITKIKAYDEKIRRLKFFSQKHEQITQAFAGINSSVWTDLDLKDDRVLRGAMHTVLFHIEKKMMEVL